MAVLLIVTIFYVALYKCVDKRGALLLALVHAALTAILTYAVVRFITSGIGMCAIAAYGVFLQ